MKKFWIQYLLIIGLGCWLAACGEKKTETAVNLDAEGEADTINQYNTVKDEQYFVKLKANGASKEFYFADKNSGVANNMDKYKTNNYTVVMITRGTYADMREKITIQLINHDLESLQFPYTLPTKEQGKSANIGLEIKKSNMPINYWGNNNCNVVITSYKDGVIEGTFSGEVTNAGKKTIKIEDGSFKVKLDKREL